VELLEGDREGMTTSRAAPTMLSRKEPVEKQSPFWLIFFKFSVVRELAADFISTGWILNPWKSADSCGRFC